MSSRYEIEAEANKTWSTMGYGIMWLFASFLLGVLPFLTGYGHFIFYILGAITAAAGIWKLVLGIQKLLK
ncbi:MAG: hypothetical protein R3345_14720 [Fulvivirga sp.]|nr:hypothetical protein [Fulvivirga sp.]